MLPKLRYFLLLLSLSVLCSSCFEVIEEINMNADGSGTMTLTINLSQSKSRVASIMLMDSINGYKVPDQAMIRKEVGAAVEKLKAMPGISNVKSSVDFTRYIASISFSFKEVNNINAIGKKLLDEYKIRSGNISTYHYNQASGTFSRDYRYYPATRTEYNKLKKEDKEIFKTATYTSICRFSRPVTRQSNPRARVSKSRKAVMQQCSVMDLINGSVSISDQIQLSKQ